MKTGTKIGILIGILLLAFGLTTMQIARHRGDGFSASIAWPGTAGGQSYDQNGYTVCTDGEERFSAAELEALAIDWLSGSVSVERYDGRDVVVREKASGELKEDECLRFRLSGGTLSILPCANKVRSLPVKELTVLIPESVTLKSVQADATSASVTLRGLDVKETAALESLSGSLRVEDCRSFALELDSSSGSQQILRCEVKNAVYAESTSGSFTAEELKCLLLETDSSSGSQKIKTLSCDSVSLSSVSGSQRVSALDCRDVASSSTSGSVHVSFAAAPAIVGVNTTSGSVELSFPAGTGIDLDFDRTSGSLHGEIVRGPIPVNVETTSGSLTIRYD